MWKRFDLEKGNGAHKTYGYSIHSNMIKGWNVSSLLLLSDESLKQSL